MHTPDGPAAGLPGSSPSEPYDLFEGTAYRGLKRLRAGGMGEVWLVEHRETHRKLAAKVIHPQLASSPAFIARMRLEAAAMGQVQHEKVARVLDFAETRTGRPFLVMDYLEGPTLAEQLEASGPMPLLDAVTFTIDILSALTAVHAKGLVHRDVKPDNLLVCRLPNGARCLKLLDFGVVRVMPDSVSVKPLPFDYRTRTGVVVGTPHYVSPEGAMGQHVDPRADLYAVGLVLYYMLVARGPFDHFEEEHSVLTAHAVEDPEPPSRHSRHPVPPELDRALMKALAKDPAERFQTAAEFQAFLESVVEHLRRPAGWMETTAYHLPWLGEEPPATYGEPPSGAPPTVHVASTPSSEPEPQDAPLTTTGQDSFRVSTIPASLLVAIVFVLAGLAAVILVTVLRGKP